jgi:hypothetical protein
MVEIDHVARWYSLRKKPVLTSAEAVELGELTARLEKTARPAWPALPKYRREPVSWQYRDHPFPGRMGRLGIINH